MSKQTEIINMLRQDTGCSRQLASQAFRYAFEKKVADYDLMIAYIRAKSLAVKTYGTLDERVNDFYKQ